jgi:hypothetical protein
MIKRLKTSTGVVAGVAALALGGSALASAATTTSTPKAEPIPARDADKLQSGSQTAPDPKAKESTGGRDRDKVQQGSKTTPDRGKAEPQVPETNHSL